MAGRQRPWRGEPHRVLPRYFARGLAASNGAKVAKIDRRRLPLRGDDGPRLPTDPRGVPIIGPDSRGAIRGTDPASELLARERRRSS